MRRLTVLVIEDDEFIRDGLREILQLEKCDVETAPDGLAALALLAAMPLAPDLILLDLNMPRMSGTEFLDHVRSQNERLSEIPVIVMTAVPGAQVSGVRAILRKPMEVEDILKKVNEFREEISCSARPIQSSLGSY